MKSADPSLTRCFILGPLVIVDINCVVHSDREAMQHVAQFDHLSEIILLQI